MGFFNLFKKKQVWDKSEKVKQLLLDLPKSSKFGIFGHKNPDPDCIYSGLAFARMLESYGFFDIKFFLEPCSELLEGAKMLTSTNCITHSKNATVDVAIIVDLSQASRIGEFEIIATKAKTILVFDHHPDALIHNTAIFSDTSATATGQILYSFFEDAEIKINEEIASLLYASIVSDSQNFTTSNTTQACIDIAQKLRAYNINTQKISDALKERFDKAEMQLLADAIKNVKYHQNGLAVFTFDAREKYKKSGVNYHSLRSKAMPIFAKSKEAQIVLCLTVFEEECRGSLRSFCHLDVDILAKKLSGGGHKKAAGFTSTLPPNYIVSIINEFYKS